MKITANAIDCLSDLGPIYIKFGQTLSTRPDLVGAEIADYLRLLQDKLPPFDGGVARKLIASLRGDIYVDEAISASKQRLSRILRMLAMTPSLSYISTIVPSQPHQSRKYIRHNSQPVNMLR